MYSFLQWGTIMEAEEDQMLAVTTNKEGSIEA